MNQIASNGEEMKDRGLFKRCCVHFLRNISVWLQLFNKQKDLKSMTLEDLQGVLKVHGVKINMFAPV